jgi:hypothetical protein
MPLPLDLLQFSSRVEKRGFFIGAMASDFLRFHKQ